MQKIAIMGLGDKLAKPADIARLAGSFYHAEWVLYGDMALNQQLITVCSVYDIKYRIPANWDILDDASMLVALWDGVQSGETWEMMQEAARRAIYTKIWEVG